MKFILTLAIFLMPAPALRSADELPKAEAVIARFVEVTGGKAGYEKVHSYIKTGTLEIPAQGIKGAFTMYEAEPGKNYVVVEIPGIGKMEEGTDGDVAWALSAMQGARLKSGDERTMVLRSGGFARELRWSKFYKSAETVGVEDVNGKTCYKVIETPIDGKPETSYYEKDSGLLVKLNARVATPMGELPVDTEISDYRKDGDILMPHRLKQNVGPAQILTTIDTVKVNVDMPKDRFDLPAEVKALVAKAK